jgi:hypothetical protein
LKIEICLDKQELRGNKMVRFEVNDDNDANIGTFLVGRAGIRWQKPKATKYHKSKSWNEVIKWLEEHGRTGQK